MSDSPFLVIACPVCGADRRTMHRYPQAICADCESRAVDAEGRALTFTNASFSGGFVAWYAGTDPQVRHDEVTRTGRCFVDGRPMHAQEARFGGIVVQPAPAAPTEGEAR